MKEYPLILTSRRCLLNLFFIWGGRGELPKEDARHRLAVANKEASGSSEVCARKLLGHRREHSLRQKLYPHLNSIESVIK